MHLYFLRAPGFPPVKLAKPQSLTTLEKGALLQIATEQ